MRHRKEAVIPALMHRYLRDALMLEEEGLADIVLKNWESIQAPDLTEWL